jgi:hypothetical protein
MCYQSSHRILLPFLPLFAVDSGGARPGTVFGDFQVDGQNSALAYPLLLEKIRNAN